MTFNAKNLHYEKQEPAFLRRLRGENTGDRHNFSIGRPRNSRLETGDDDGPTIVDERGESMTEQEYRDLLNGKVQDEVSTGKTATASRPDNTEPENQSSLLQTADSATKKTKEPLATIHSGTRKRKPIKIVSDKADIESLTARDDHLTSDSRGERDGTVKSKKKRIKLSFDDAAI